MPRPEKVQAVAEIKERLAQANAVFLAEYAGLSVKDQQKLRRGLREGGAEFKVVKMTLAKRAADELDYTDLDELLLGPTGIAFADGDPVTAAKALKDFAKENEALYIKGGLLGGEFLTPERISELAEIESRDVLLAKIAGLMQAPMANLAGLLAAMPRNLATAIQQLVEKKEAAGDAAPDAEPVAEAEEASEEEAAGEAVAADAEASAEDDAPAPEEPTAAAETDEAKTATKASATEASSDEESEESSDDSDGDDAKSVDEDPAEEAEEE